MNELRYGLTIFTPTYNRQNTLPRLYESIKSQENDLIEWLIVDDGSSDETEKIISAFIESETGFNIRYVKKTNGGKHTALNIGIDLAEMSYFICVDSDDILSQNAVKNIFKVIDNKKPDGIIAYKRDLLTGKQIGEDFPYGLHLSTLFALINRYKSNGDRTLIFRTSLIKNIHIPEPNGVKFFPETYLYDRFDEKYSSILLRESLCECEYLEDGYSASFRMLMIKNAVSMKMFYAARIDMDDSFKYKFNMLFHYTCFLILSHQPIDYLGLRNTIIFLLAFPIGSVLALKYIMLKN